MSDTGNAADIAVWTDFGGVLTPPISHTMTNFCRSMRLDPGQLSSALATVTARYGTDDIMEPIDTPLVTEEAWLREVGQVLRTDFGVEVHLTTLADAWFDGREVNEDWLAVLRRVRARGTFVGVLSNMVPTWDAHWRRMVDPAANFDGVILSFEVGHRKPSPDMFALASAQAGVPPERCVLVDDLERNCVGARAAGWQAITFRDAASAAAELDLLLAAPTTGPRSSAPPQGAAEPSLVPTHAAQDTM